MKFLVLATLLSTTAFAGPVKIIKGSEAIEEIFYSAFDTEIEGNSGDDCLMMFEKSKITKELTVGIKKDGKTTSVTIKPNDKIKTNFKGSDAGGVTYYKLPSGGFLSLSHKEDISDFDLEINPTGKRGDTVECSWME